ncbi:uncharacterized protein LOC113316346 [Papaver somniferum]|uniref:uncharacterized protein LOC113316346 n=1 Tax=Papaver somniferum TaxID=3469 RepID=UPI000E701AD3|nr:uncharacterized protein LOC113316346 [Papaver somniferum]
MVETSDQSSPSSPIHTNNETQINSSGNTRTLDPYIIHPSDNPATVLSSPLLQGDNYGSWVRGITKALNAKDKLGNNDGSDVTISSAVGFSTLANQTSGLAAFSPYSREIWKDLEVRFCISNAPILFRLKSAIAAIRQESMSVSMYYTKIKTLWDQYHSLVAATEVCICGAGKSLLERLERDRAMEFLQGLHDRFSNLISQILMMDPFPTAIRIFNMVQQEEEQQHITASPLPAIEAPALNTNRHHPQTSRSAPATHHKRPRPHCDYCNRHGHIRERCYRLHGFPSSSATTPTAANTTATQEFQPMQPAAIPAFSSEQYSRLLALINPPGEDTSVEPRVNLAGKIFNTLLDI